MAKEIERKFLVKNDSYKNLARPILLKQGYLSVNPKATVRIRTKGDVATLTVKGMEMGITRSEFEYEIPLDEAETMLLELCLKPIIEKYRYLIDYSGFIWEVDEFLGDNLGLVVAEIELADEQQAFSKPDFIGEEVTFDYRYRNSNLIKNPYKNWT